MQLVGKKTLRMKVYAMNASDHNQEEAITYIITLLIKYKQNICYFSNLATFRISQMKYIKNNLKV